MKTSAVVVTYNRLEILKKNLDAIFNQTVPVNNIIVIDNLSTDGTSEYLQSLGSKIIHVRMTKKGGGAYGFNKGIKYFIEKTTDDFVWIMDDDTIPMVDTLEQLLKAAKSLIKFGFLYSNVRWKDGSFSEPNHPWKDGKPLQDSDGSQPIHLNEGNFVSLLMKRSIIESIGLPYKEFFIWQDDIEYTQRANGIEPGYWIPMAKVEHKTAINIAPSLLTIDKSRINRYFFDIRNALFTRRAHKGIFSYILLLFIKMAKSFQILFTRTDYKLTKFKVVWSGIIASLKFNPKKEFTRKLD